MEKLPEQLSDDEIIDKALSVYHYSRFGSHDLFCIIKNFECKTAAVLQLKNATLPNLRELYNG